MAVCKLPVTFSGCYCKAWSHHLQLHNKPITILVLDSLPHTENYTNMARSRDGEGEWALNRRVHLHNVLEQVFSNRTERLKTQSTTWHNEETSQLTKIFTDNKFLSFIVYLCIWTILSNKCFREFICGLLFYAFFLLTCILFYRPFVDLY